MEPSPEHPGTRRAGWILAAFAVVYAFFFVSYCSLDDAPRPWDEAFFLYHPTTVASALERDGVLAAARAFWETRYHKPPLSMFGTLPAVVLFGDGSVAYRLDNLAVALLAGWLLFAYFRRFMAAELAAASAVLILLAPYALSFARVELAELYVWAAAILYLWALERSGDLSRRSGCVLLGLALGCGLLAKATFPMIVVGPSLWVFARALWSGHGERRRRLVNLVLAGVVGAVLCAPFYAKNWKPIWGHIKQQYGWVGKHYGMGDPWTVEYLRSYLASWLESLGEISAALAVLSIVLCGVAVAARRSVALFRGWPAGPLAAGFVVNLVYCYFHPVVDMRFTLGSFLMLQMFVAILAARSLKALGAERGWIAYVAVAPSLIFLLGNSYLPGSGAFALKTRNLPLVGATYLLGPPEKHPALGREILTTYRRSGGDAFSVALIGDHGRLNNDNLRLEMVRLGIRGDVTQLGYLGPYPELGARERMERVPGADLWVVIEERGGGPPRSWTSQCLPGVLELLRSNPQVFRQLDWKGSLADGSRVLLFQRVGELGAAVHGPATDPPPSGSRPASREKH